MNEMTNSSARSSRIVIDASATIWTLLPVMSTADMAGKFAAWRTANVEIHAPSLWLVECTSVIRRCVHTSLLTDQEGLTTLEHLFALEVETAPITPARCRAALAWATKLRQAKAYDSFYLALADELDASFVTADQRLANSARQLGLAWVYWVDDAFLDPT
jgi:predicted nucleic acid-binding protein